jgi:nicotinate-nucleotide adenylyltransferase
MTISLPHSLSGPAWAGRTVGLLGGSFNPPHAGHLHDSLLALRRLKLDQVWWLVSPQNPLKPRKGMAPFDQRLAAARDFTTHPRIVVSDIEARLGTTYTADTLDRLASLYPRTRFVWLMGADNMIQIRHWERWQDIFASVPVAVFDRPPYSTKVEGCLAARRFACARAKGSNQTGLSHKAPPAWAFFHTPLKDLSSTVLREKGFWAQ